MCSLTNKIKFCTCEEKAILDKEKNWIWTLRRKDMDRELSNIQLRGICLTLNFTDNDVANIIYILEALEKDNPFDFLYTPEEGDVLVVDYKQKSYEFMFENKQWQEQNTLSPHGDVIFKKGIIMEAKEFE